MLTNLRLPVANETAFVPTMVGVFTWFAVGRYNSGTDLLNTFQAVLGSNPSSNRSFITFCFDNLLYDFGSASVGTRVVSALAA